MLKTPKSIAFLRERGAFRTVSKVQDGAFVKMFNIVTKESTKTKRLNTNNQKCKKKEVYMNKRTTLFSAPITCSQGD